MATIVAITCVLVVLAAILFKRRRDRDELEQHSITPEDLHALLVSNKEVALFDVRLPLDLLGNSVVIPGAKRLDPEEVISNPLLIPNDRDSIFSFRGSSTRSSETNVRSIVRITLGCTAVVQVYFVLIAVAKPLYAYADPGTGMLMLQVVSSMVAGAVFFLRSKIRRLFGPAPIPRVTNEGDQETRNTVGDLRAPSN